MFILDSCTIIELLDATEVGIKIQEEYLNKDIATTAFSMHEVLRSLNEKSKIIAFNFFEQLPILSFTRKSAEKSFPIENYLKATGTMINKIDILIAGICQEHDASIVTLDKDFLRVPKLRVRMLEQ
ncbi:MAG TPA: type II toxin-antitoxin system VapC family toxin [Candidatus Nanoarchaeia archaeon]|nr:type II toxin-antitoxin system VapC family toxin [Candidatus Nanoarchaeia archaeon]